MKEPRRRWNGVPPCVREELGIRARAFYSYRVSSHGPIRRLEDQVPWRRTGLWQGGAVMRDGFSALQWKPVISCCTVANPDLLILIVSAYCSGLRCSRSNLN